MREIVLVVDGYNVINSWEYLSEIMKDSLEDARDALIRILQNYAGYKNRKVLLIFDGHKAKENTGSKYQEGNLEVVYTPEGTSADQHIEKEVGNLLRHYQVYVATSDKLQQEIIWSKGAYRISARELIGEISRTETEYREVLERKAGPKRNYLESNLSGPVRDQLEKMRRKKH